MARIRRGASSRRSTSKRQRVTNSNRPAWLTKNGEEWLRVPKDSELQVKHNGGARHDACGRVSGAQSTSKAKSNVGRGIQRSSVKQH